MGQRAILNSLALLGLALQVVSGSSWGYNHASPSVLDPNEDNEQSIIDISSQLTNLKKLFEEFETVEKAILAGEKTQDKYDELIGSLKSEIESIDQLINGQSTSPGDRDNLDKIRQEIKKRVDEAELKKQLDEKIETLNEDIAEATQSENSSKVNDIESEIKSLKESLGKAKVSAGQSTSSLNRFLESAQERLKSFESKLNQLSHSKSSKIPERIESELPQFQTGQLKETSRNELKPSSEKPSTPNLDLMPPTPSPPLTYRSLSENLTDTLDLKSADDSTTPTMKETIEKTSPEPLNWQPPRTLDSLLSDSPKTLSKRTAPTLPTVSNPTAPTTDTKIETNKDLGYRPLQDDNSPQQLGYAPEPKEFNQERSTRRVTNDIETLSPQELLSRPVFSSINTEAIEETAPVETILKRQNFLEPKPILDSPTDITESSLPASLRTVDSLSVFLKEQSERAMTQKEILIADSMLNFSQPPLKFTETNIQPMQKQTTESPSNWLKKLRLWLGL